MSYKIRMVPFFKAHYSITKVIVLNQKIIFF